MKDLEKMFRVLSLYVVGLRWFLFLLYGVSDGVCQCGDPNCSSPGKHPYSPLAPEGFKSATNDIDVLAESWTNHPVCNIGLQTGIQSGVVVLDIDTPQAEENIRALNGGELPKTFTAITSKGRHLYFKHPGGKVPNQTKSGTHGFDVRGDGGYVVLPPSKHMSGHVYQWEAKTDIAEIPDYLHGLIVHGKIPWDTFQVPVSISKSSSDFMADGIRQGGRHSTLVQYVGHLYKTGISEAKVRALALGKNMTYEPPLEDKEVDRIVSDIGAKEANKANKPNTCDDETLFSLLASSEWIEPLGEAAFRGLAGQIVKTIAPTSEADPNAILIQLMCSLGVCFGRNPYFEIEADRHYLNEFVLVVGHTSTGRKGTSIAHINRLLGLMPDDTTSIRISGLSSGEGLIVQANTAVETHRPLLVTETEFANVLVVKKREGNTLTGIIRQLWDTGTAGTVTKKEPLHVKNAHVSIIGHVTPDELLRTLGGTDISNGFLNRFLICLVRRSKKLSRGGKIDPGVLKKWADELEEVVKFAQSVGEMTRTDAAWQYWDEIYDEISVPPVGTAGDMMARATGHITRLSCIYALLDKTTVVDREHLEAAMAVWRYCCDSVRYVFGDSTGNAYADKLYAELLNRFPEGMTGREVAQMFNNHPPAIQSALRTLEQANRIEVQKAASTGGRPSMIVYAKQENKANKAA